MKSNTAECPNCKKIFVKKTKPHTYCCYQCKYDYNFKSVAVREERICPVCGKKYTSSNKRQKYCSRRCQKQFNGSENRYNRKLSSDDRLRMVTGSDRKVWLLPLVKRDKNICALCGKPCDLYDYEITETGIMIAGEKYPSIDHIVPISKGGLHKWDNVQLAHRSCNRIKGNGENK